MNNFLILSYGQKYDRIGGINYRNSESLDLKDKDLNSIEINKTYSSVIDVFCPPSMIMEPILDLKTLRLEDGKIKEEFVVFIRKLLLIGGNYYVRSQFYKKDGTDNKNIQDNWCCCRRCEVSMRIQYPCQNRHHTNQNHIRQHYRA